MCKKYDNKDYLYVEHIIKRKTMSQIAKENNVSGDTIRRYMQKYNIDYWQKQYSPPKKEQEIEDIVNMYCYLEMSANQIAQCLNISHSTVRRILRNKGTQLRNRSEAQFNCYNKKISELFDNVDYLKSLHWEQGKSCKEIGKIFNVDGGTVRRKMHSLGIETKNNSQTKIGQMRGSKHPNWQGGITSLTKLVREWFHTNLVPIIAKRDNYTCQLCGAKHTVIHIHHKKSFSDIIKEIISEHSNLDISNQEDKIKLYEIIISDKRFLDKDNLIAYCKECHYFKIHNYKKQDN